MNAMADEAPTTDPNSATPTVEPFDAFFAPHLPVLLRVAQSLCHNTHDAEDLVQDTLIRAFKGRPTFDGAHPRAWLLTIMRNANINRNRRQRPQLLRDATDLAGETDRRNPPAPSAEHEASTRTRAPWIDEALTRLSPRHREVVELVDIDGLSYDEAAATLDIPTGTVMSRLHRARHRMRTYLTVHPDFRSDPQ